MLCQVSGGEAGKEQADSDRFMCKRMPTAAPMSATQSMKERGAVSKNCRVASDHLHIAKECRWRRKLEGTKAIRGCTLSCKALFTKMLSFSSHGARTATVFGTGLYQK